MKRGTQMTTTIIRLVIIVTFTFHLLLHSARRRRADDILTILVSSSLRIFHEDFPNQSGGDVSRVKARVELKSVPFLVHRFTIERVSLVVLLILLAYPLIGS